jgi:hypothetical protein
MPKARALGIFFAPTGLGTSSRRGAVPSGGWIVTFNLQGIEVKGRADKPGMTYAFFINS